MKSQWLYLLVSVTCLFVIACSGDDGGSTMAGGESSNRAGREGLKAVRTFLAGAPTGRSTDDRPSWRA